MTAFPLPRSGAHLVQLRHRAQCGGPSVDPCVFKEFENCQSYTAIPPHGGQISQQIRQARNLAVRLFTDIRSVMFLIPTARAGISFYV